MDLSRCHDIAPDKYMFHINTDIVILAVVSDSILFNPSRIQVLLLQTVWVFIATLRRSILFDLLVVFSAMPLLLLRRSLRLGNWNQRGINDLTATGLEAMFPKI